MRLVSNVMYGCKFKEIRQRSNQSLLNDDVAQKPRNQGKRAEVMELRCPLSKWARERIGGICTKKNGDNGVADRVT
jgi:hypothetical protein